MLLRSASSPILNSFTPLAAKEYSPEPESVSQFHRTRTLSLTASSSGSLSPVDHECYPKRITRARSDSNLRDLRVQKKKHPLTGFLDGLVVEEEESDLGEVSLEEVGDLTIGSFGGMFSASAPDSLCDVGNGGVGGGSICGGGGGGGGSDGGDGGNGGFGDEWENDRRNEDLDAYYQRMIEADPGNPMLLSNYAKYLKELRGDLVKAEGYCGRAILMNQNDGDTLSMYGDLIWQLHKDAKRAEAYFDLAVKASPDNCYVMASYAHFLFEAEDEEEEEEEVEEEPVRTSPASSFLGIPPPIPPIASVS